MLEIGIIEKSKSQWASPLITADPYYLPRIEELLFKIDQANLYILLTLCKGFYQILMAQADKEKTAFIPPLGKYHFT